jgi:hypothetical protein
MPRDIIPAEIIDPAAIAYQAFSAANEAAEFALVSRGNMGVAEIRAKHPAFAEEKKAADDVFAAKATSVAGVVAKLRALHEYAWLETHEADEIIVDIADELEAIERRRSLV